MTDEPAPAIELRGVHKAFGTLRVLDDVSLAIPAGRGFCILGRSGTGKSVMLRHIIGLVRPDEGRVFVTGEEVSALGLRHFLEVFNPNAPSGLAPQDAAGRRVSVTDITVGVASVGMVGVCGAAP